MIGAHLRRAKPVSRSQSGHDMNNDTPGMKMTYAAAGVDIDAATQAKKRIRGLARATFTPGVLTDIGSFGALFRLELDRYAEPLLVSSCDGVGTKLKVAFMTGIHDTVGYDLVSHCVSDIMVQGARPLFFLDYIACGKLEPGVVEQVVSGLARGCREAGCALIGGETAEMPDFYAPGEYDLAGFIVGVVDRPRLIDGSRIRTGDILLGLPSAGLHTNGYSLARRLFFERLGLGPVDRVPELGATVAEALLAPHRSYYSLLEPLLDSGVLRGMAHITGGGITDNLPRILPAGSGAVVRRGSWPVTPIFRFIQRQGEVDDAEMYRTFNMGIGMILVVAPEDAATVVAELGARGEICHRIGEIAEGDGTVRYV
jgi:phosphoribosylformylglycinamidine cyclo-ligase